MSKKKKRARASMKRSQKDAIKRTARSRLNRKVKHAMSKMRHSARIGKNVIDVGSQQHIRDIESSVEIPTCDGVGQCCCDTMVSLDPSDVWRIMHNDKARETFGIDLTTDLSKSPEERGLIRYWLDPRTGAPRCSLRQDTGEDGNRYCSFFQIDGDEYSCLLGDDKPTICRANPIGRVGKTNELGRLIGWGYVSLDAPCSGCPKNCDSREWVIEDWIKEKKMEERYALKDMFHGFVGWLVREVKPEEIRQLAAMLIFDYDRFPMNVGGLDAEKVKENRPQSPEQLLVGARMIIDGIMRGQSAPEDKSDEGDQSDSASEENLVAE